MFNKKPIEDYNQENQRIQQLQPQPQMQMQQQRGFIPACIDGTEHKWKDSPLEIDTRTKNGGVYVATTLLVCTKCGYVHRPIQLPILKIK
jgi:hypothetical protein